jgi:hypothetical protein
LPFKALPDTRPSDTTNPAASQVKRKKGRRRIRVAALPARIKLAERKGRGANPVAE